MNFKILLPIALLLSAISFGQSSKLKRADGYYNMLAYSLAVKNYEELVGSNLDTPQLKSKLAVCYAQLGETVKAEEMYSKMIFSGSEAPEDIYQYAQLLKKNGKYQEADTWMKKFVAAKPDDSRAVEFKKSMNYLDQINQQEAHFELKALNVNSPDTDFGAYPSADGKSIYFVSSRYEKVYTDRTWTWNNERFLELYKGNILADQSIADVKHLSKQVNSKFHEGPLCFNKKGDLVYFTRNNISTGSNRVDEKGIQNLKIYTAQVGKDDSWTNIKECNLNSKEYSIGHPTISADGAYLYYASDMPGGFGGTDIYKSVINSDGSLGKPENLGGMVNTEGKEMFPWMSNEGHLYFSSDGHLGLGGLDVFVILPNKKGEFTKRFNLGKPMNSQLDDFALSLNVDNQHGYLSSNRSGGSGQDDIYAFTLVKPYKSTILLDGKIVEKTTSELIPEATIDLIDEEGTIIQTSVSDAKGNYTFELEPDLHYQIAVRKKDYFDNSERVSTVDIPYGSDNVKQDVKLEKDPGLSLYVLIRDASNNLPLQGVAMNVVETYTKEPLIDVVTGSTGDAMKGVPGKKMGEKISYTISLKKEGFLTKSVIFSTTIKEAGIINVHDALDLTMDKIAIGGDLAKMVDLKPIYFDLGKSKIRPDAAAELDKIVKVMNDYPTMEVELGSHTDCRGNKASNEKLSNTRALASAAYVRQRISNPYRINGKGFGESKLINDCGCEGKVKSSCSELEHQQNRRTEFIILKM